jgi:hypothetical protein
LLCGEIELKYVIVRPYWRVVEWRLVITRARTKDEVEAIASVSTLELGEREKRSWRQRLPGHES